MANETYVGMMEGPQTALSSEQKDKDSERKEEPDETADTTDGSGNSSVPDRAKQISEGNPSEKCTFNKHIFFLPMIKSIISVNRRRVVVFNSPFCYFPSCGTRGMGGVSLIEKNVEFYKKTEQELKIFCSMI